jgi:hypothetical protein
MTLQTLPTLPLAVSCSRKLLPSSASLKSTLQPFRQAFCGYVVDVFVLRFFFSEHLEYLVTTGVALVKALIFSVLQPEADLFPVWKIDGIFVSQMYLFCDVIQWVANLL